MTDWLKELDQCQAYYETYGDFAQHANNAIRRNALLNEHARELITMTGRSEYNRKQIHAVRINCEAESGKLRALLRQLEWGDGVYCTVCGAPGGPYSHTPEPHSSDCEIAAAVK